jgi:putative ABC transport system permease protein
VKLYDSFRSALQSLVVNKLRSALTMLGVIIGVASVIAMVAVGNGASQQVQNTILSLGSNLITVSPGNLTDQGLRGAGQQAQNLTLDDMKSLQAQLGSSIAAIHAEQGAGRWQVTAAGQNWNTNVNGVTEQYPLVRDWNMQSGDFFTESPDHQRAGRGHRRDHRDEPVRRRRRGRPDPAAAPGLRRR